MSDLVTIDDLGDDRVRVTYTMGIEPKALLAPVLRVAKRGVQKNLGKALDALGERLA